MIETGMSVYEAKLQSTKFFVEATSAEQHFLWKEFHEKTNWVEDNCGVSRQVGSIGNDESKPVWVNFRFAEINGKRICMYEATSRYVDHTLVKNYIKENYPVKYDNNTRLAMTDAMNFHLVVEVTEESSEKEINIIKKHK